MAIRIAAFSGIAPRKHRRALDQDQAQVAANCNLTSGVVRSLRGNNEVYLLTGYSTPVLTIYRMNDGANDFWLGWTRKINAVKGPIAGDTTHRLYFTGDGEPRATNLALATSAAPYPTTKYVMGVFPPATAPTVVHSSGSGSAESRAYCYTFVTQWGEESQPSPASGVIVGTVSGTWTISNMDVAPPNSGTVTAAVKDTPATGQTEVTLDSVFGLRAGEEVTFASVGGMTDLNATFELVSVDTATSKVVVTLATTQTYTSGGTWARVAGHNTTSMMKRIYRTVTTASGTEYQFVKEIAVATTSTTDGVTALGETLPSADWAMPPTDLMGLVEMQGGIMAGISGNEICFSEPWKPYAWPEGYRQALAFDGAALMSFGASLIAATTGTPYVLTGAHPDSMTVEKIDEAWPASNQQGAVSMLAGGMYVSPYGLVLGGPGGIAVVSKDLYTEREWAGLEPETFVAAEHDGRYIAAHGDNGESGLLIFDKSERASLITANVTTTAVYRDQESGRLYLVLDNIVHEFDSDDSGTRMLYDWKSKEFISAPPVNLAAARVDADFSMTEAEQTAAAAAIAAIQAANAALIASESLLGAHGESMFGEFELGGDAMEDIPPATYDSLTFMLYADNELKFTKTLTKSRAFKLPDGYKADNYAIRLAGNVLVSGVVLGSSMKDLRTA